MSNETNTSVTTNSTNSLGTYEDLILAHGNNKSSLIRYLSSQGWKRGEIAKFMNIRYQHVRNVLIQPLKKV